MKNGDTNMDLLKAIKSVKEVFLDVPLNSRSIWVKVIKKELLESIERDPTRFADELEIVTKYGKSAIYLGRKV